MPSRGRPGFLSRQADGFADLLAGRVSRLVAVLAGFCLALWLVVPVHELLHAAGCLATGGTVTRLEIQPLWGGRLLERVLPWVVAGGEYAGRLSGFSPAGDLSYLVTVLLPHVLFAPLGALLCRRAAQRTWPVLFGAGLAAATQPLASLTGDMYESASIPLTALARALGAPWALLLRGDDLEMVVRQAIALGSPWALSLTALGAVLGGALAAALFRLSGGVVPVALRQAEPQPRCPERSSHS